ncbi:MAG TPA: hydroxymethylglutaryl-CoA lyase [Acidimicrobiales bacterium]|nr:hydroxymethylglutaryl-CoA lyase [Acidimicrobiales bacterium]
MPAAVGHPDLPAEVTVYEVGPRDGLQNEAAIVPLEAKLELIARLSGSGLRVIEVTSLVRPEMVPQLADAEQILGCLERVAGVRYPVLVPNMRGLERALAAGVTEVSVPASATEAFAERNLGRGREESLKMLSEAVHAARQEGLPVRGYVSMCFGDPWEGDVEPDAVAGVVGQLLAMGCGEVSLGDTIGVATPGAVGRLVTKLVAAGASTGVLAVHFHDTYGQALANTFEALRSGITTVDASAGGLGGCPFAGSATGNLATEDLVFHLDGLGIRTGIDLAALARTSLWLAGKLGRSSPSRTVQALAARSATVAGEAVETVPEAFGRPGGTGQ